MFGEGRLELSYNIGAFVSRFNAQMLRDALEAIHSLPVIRSYKRFPLYGVLGSYQECAVSREYNVCVVLCWLPA